MGTDGSLALCISLRAASLCELSRRCSNSHFELSLYMLITVVLQNVRTSAHASMPLPVRFATTYTQKVRIRQDANFNVTVTNGSAV